MQCMQNFLTHILSGYSLSILTTVLWNHGIYEIRCKRPMALQCTTLKYRHNNSVHTMERLVALLNKSVTFSKHPAQQNWCFDYENNNKLHKMTIQNVRKKISHVLHFNWTILIKYFSSCIKKCQTRTYFLVECIYKSMIMKGLTEFIKINENKFLKDGFSIYLLIDGWWWSL